MNRRERRAQGAANRKAVRLDSRRFDESLFVTEHKQPLLMGPAQFRDLVAGGYCNERGWVYRKPPPRAWIQAALGVLR